MTNGRVSNLIGATFSTAGLGAAAGLGAFAAAAGAGAALGLGGLAGLARGVFATASLAARELDADLVGFTVTFDVAMGFAFVGVRTAFLGAATFAVAFFGIAFPGRLAALLGFFEGI
jgi:hypothetical protein